MSSFDGWYEKTEFETCDQHTYLFATEGKDCPYCEIDRLKGELEEARDEAFKREARIMMYVNQVCALEHHLAEARAEVDRYKAGVEVVGHVCMQELGASIPGLSEALLAYPHNVRVLIMKLEG